MKSRKQLTIEQEKLERFEKYAAATNRSLSELMIEATEQMIRRYTISKTKSIKDELAELQKKIEETYKYVP